MTAELTVLAEAGAAVVVAAMATDLWQGTRDAVLGLFGRVDRRRRDAVEAQLDANAALVRTATVPDDVRRALFDFWAQELAELLRRDPSGREELARLTHEVGGALPVDRRAFVLEQTNTATDFATIFAVQHGDLRTPGTRP
ncbi:hypothetical protein [Embleya sp. NPDC005575]|uniref:hypothetical protein n=1 Tax=Embleya sp. NPDC005575 TaxID=3156892 RepID=UPI0033A2D45E